MSEVKRRTNCEMWLGEFSRRKLMKKSPTPYAPKEERPQINDLVSTLSKSHKEETATHDSAYFQLSPALGKQREEDYEFKCKKDSAPQEKKRTVMKRVK